MRYFEHSHQQNNEKLMHESKGNLKCHSLERFAVFQHSPAYIRLTVHDLLSRKCIQLFMLHQPTLD
jgi:hypothetical protein